MLSKEYLDSWNELCAECKMVESDLANPSEKWLTRVLISYLRMFGYRVEIPCSEEGSREKRIFLIKLVRHIDHIYKISDKSFTFTYYDLLKPCKAIIETYDNVNIYLCIFILLKLPKRRRICWEFF